MKKTIVSSLPNGQAFQIIGLEGSMRNLKVRNVSYCGTYIMGEKKMGVKFISEEKGYETVWGQIGEGYVISNGTEVYTE